MARRVFSFGKSILPTQVIPIIDMKGDRNDLFPKPGIGLQPAEPGFGRRAAESDNDNVDRADNRLYWTLIHRFGELTGVPVLLNTSFNENEPIVLRPEEALDCFLRTNMDVLVMGHHVLTKDGVAKA